MGLNKMEIKQIFDKSIDRDIQGVIKAEQVEDDVVQQDLAEYVVTSELQKHFSRFFDAYAQSINNKTDKIGVWISGFFGSGKSHFLKILSYLLENREVYGKHAIDFFEDKIIDPMTLANMHSVAGIDTDVMLFNIDSKASSDSKSDKEAIMHVFMQVFNDMRGYYGANLYVADLEEELDQKGKLKEFKQAFQDADSRHESWEKGRRSLILKQRAAVKALLEVGQFDSEDMARDWIKSTRNDYSLSIEDFAKRINDYLDSKERTHHIAFLVDEMGQYIGDSRERMLNLQTVTEDLGHLTNGRAWVVVTAQEEIDSLAKADTMHKADFSKIQGRFDTRISMSSSNVDEVIKRRLLEKTDSATTSLKAMYRNQGTSIDNKLHFNDNAERKLYKTDLTFSEVYPFVPYQFNLVGDVLRAIRDNSINGKHQSEGERSMLAMYQDAARTIENSEIGKLVSFDMFYDPVDQFLDHMYASVITKAEQNDHINPDHESNTFNIRVLKTLFLVKYVKTFKTNIDNIVSLLIDNVSTDRLTLEQEVKKALGILETENFVQKNIDVYEFLTDAEQDVNREIKNEYIDQSILQQDIGDRVYGSLIPKKYGYMLPNWNKSAFKGRYVFEFVNYVDDRVIGRSQQTDMEIRIVTDLNDESNDETRLRMDSTGNKIMIDLPAGTSFTEDLRHSKQIEQFIQRANTQRTKENIQSIILAKQTENEAISADVDHKIKEALNHATLYLNGKPLENQTTNFESNINQAMDDLIKRVYNKLDHITAAKNIDDLKYLLNQKKKNIDLNVAETANQLALDDVKEHIALSGTISLKNIRDQFVKAPYGYYDDDISWLIGKLFVDGVLKATLNGDVLSPIDQDSNMIDYITKRQYQDKILLTVRQAVSNSLKRSVNEVAEVYWDRTFTGADEEIFKKFVERAGTSVQIWKDYLKQSISTSKPAYPGQDTLRKVIDLFEKITAIKDINQFFESVDRHLDMLLDLYDQDGLNDIEEFYRGTNDQREIWDRSINLIKWYNSDSNYLFNDEHINSIYKHLYSLVDNVKPFSHIKDMPSLNAELEQSLDKKVSEMQTAVVVQIEEYLKSGQDYLANSGLDKNLAEPFIGQINQAKVAAGDATSLSKVDAARQAAKQIVDQFMRSIDAQVKAIKEQEKRAAKEKQNNQTEKVRTGNEHVDTSTSLSVSSASKETSEDNSHQAQAKENLYTQKRLQANHLNNVAPNWTIKSEQDLDNYLTTLRATLLNELEDTDIVHVEL